MDNSLLNISIIQFVPVLGNPDATLSRLEELFNTVKEADLVIMPELANSGYNFKSNKQAFELAEEEHNSRFLDFLHEKAKKGNFYVVSGFNEKEGKKLFNSSVLLGPEGIIGKYRKIHLFMNEKNIFEPGNLGLPVFEVNGIKLGMLICFDYLFPEIWRIMALKGADLVCHPSNLVTPFGGRVAPVQAIINRYFVATANRTGTEGDITFRGEFFIADPNGEFLAKASKNLEEVIHASIDPQMARDKMITEKNHVLADRMPEYYKEILDL